MIVKIGTQSEKVDPIRKAFLSTLEATKAFALRPHLQWCVSTNKPVDRQIKHIRMSWTKPILMFFLLAVKKFISVTWA